MPLSRRQRIGVAALTGALFAGAVGAWFGSRQYRPETYKQVDDPSKPKYEATVSYRPGPVNYTFKHGDTVWTVTSRMYGSELKTNNDVASKVNYVVKKEAPNHRHYGNHLMKDTKAVVGGKVVKQADGIRGDEIQAGDVLVFPDVPNAVKDVNPKGKIIGYEKKSVLDKAEIPSRAWPYGLLGGLLGAAVGSGLGYLFTRRRGGPEGEGPPEPPAGGDGGEGGGPEGGGPAGGPEGGGLRPEEGGPEGGDRGWDVGRRDDLDLHDIDERLPPVEPAERPEGEEMPAFGAPRPGPRPVEPAGSVVPFRRRTLNDSELSNAGRSLMASYLDGMSVSSAVRGYVGLSTADGYRMLAESKLSTPGEYRWNRRLAEATGELADIQVMALDGTAKDAAARIRGATGFKISESTIYRMRRKAADAKAEAAA